MKSFPTRFATACFVAMAALVGFVAPSARGDIVVNYQDVGSDLQFSWSGSIPFTPNTTGTATLARINSSSLIVQDLYALTGDYLRQTLNDPQRTPDGTGLFAVTNFGARSGTMTGDGFAFTFNSLGTFLFVDAGYSAGDSINGTLTIPNFSVAAAGLSDVSFALTEGGNVTFQQAVPEPSALALCGVAVAGLGFAGVRRRLVR